MHIVYKHIGETPLQCIQRLFDTTTNSYTYAGRLDPIAEGLLLILENEECKQAKRYHNLTKTYEYAFAVGISTDSYDCLGKITDIRYPQKPLDKKVHQIINAGIGTHTLPYPPYSSKTVNGKPLFQYARENTLHTITIPAKTIQVTEHTLTKIQTTTTSNLKKEITANIRKVTGDFRQGEILRQWQALPDNTIQNYAATITATAGTYIRAIVHEIGNRIGYPTVTTHIKRTGIGTWTKEGVYEEGQ
ncbi:MAG: hypothetical protein OXB96_03100 [Candidatus Kaiserbacteria bacterium]|nr:hypothetical protein [Candidatus Kaiserbacteria bacterium]